MQKQPFLNRGVRPFSSISTCMMYLYSQKSGSPTLKSRPSGGCSYEKISTPLAQRELLPYSPVLLLLFFKFNTMPSRMDTIKLNVEIKCFLYNSVLMIWQCSYNAQNIPVLNSSQVLRQFRNDFLNTTC